MGLTMLLLGLAGAVALFGAAAWRVRRARPPQEIVESRHVSDLAEGRFRVVGRIGAMQTVSSAVDASPCVYVDVSEFRSFGGALAQEVVREVRATPFLVDDGTGLVWVDPREAEIEAVTVQEDLGLTAERRLRVGEEVEVVGTFRRLEVESEGGPYRGVSSVWSVGSDAHGAPRVSYRTEPEMVLAGDELAAFFRGAGVLLVAAGSLIALLVS
ncbi:MAG: E3 ubiquitin ligase family protein [Myxococcota bacterium]|nr:E3 ubiquitin ligase family protein [Myxococcota bacterium]